MDRSLATERRLGTPTARPPRRRPPHPQSPRSRCTSSPPTTGHRSTEQHGPAIAVHRIVYGDTLWDILKDHYGYVDGTSSTSWPTTTGSPTRRTSRSAPTSSCRPSQPTRLDGRAPAADPPSRRRRRTRRSSAHTSSRGDTLWDIIETPLRPRRRRHGAHRSPTTTAWRTPTSSSSAPRSCCRHSLLTGRSLRPPLSRTPEPAARAPTKLRRRPRPRLPPPRLDVTPPPVARDVDAAGRSAGRRFAAGDAGGAGHHRRHGPVGRRGIRTVRRRGARGRRRTSATTTRCSTTPFVRCGGKWSVARC